ncbi:hypothetical protein PAHAL_9G180000 [Panicum hallii]|uniref:Uncharacterized protein n=1 Tax=Panicum hallii TaxID=206008 RepID=A0A2T8I1K4_9POAL|nr:hypothetical protein PAHAL_9G180000 [Panicum hallii]
MEASRRAARGLQRSWAGAGAAVRGAGPCPAGRRGDLRRRWRIRTASGRAGNAGAGQADEASCSAGAGAGLRPVARATPKLGHGGRFGRAWRCGGGTEAGAADREIGGRNDESSPTPVSLIFRLGACADIVSCMRHRFHIFSSLSSLILSPHQTFANTS